MKENEFWVGTFCGFICALILAIVSMFYVSNELKAMNMRYDKLEQEHKEIAKWIEDNKTVMQTYKFFNESWEAILDYEQRDKL